MQSDLLADLLRATECVDRLARGELEMSDFLREYDDHYHSAALDGHEGHREELATLQPQVLLHEQVQATLDLLAPPGMEEDPAYLAAGRISRAEAARRLREIAEAGQVQALLEDLRQRLRAPPSPPRWPVVRYLLVIAVVAAAGILVVGMSRFISIFRQWDEIDSCYDDGGYWDDGRGVCVNEAPARATVSPDAPLLTP